MPRLLISGFIFSLLLLWSFSYADQTIQVPPFTAIKSKGVFDMEIIVGREQSVLFRGKDEKFNKLSVRVVDSELLINGSGEFVIAVPTLNLFHGKGVGKIEILQIHGDKVDISFEGVGKLEATGRVKSLQLKGLGVGEINAQKLLAENADVDLKGVGDAKVYVSNQLNAVTRGVGALTYHGRPRTVNNSSTGIGRVGAGN